MNTRRDIYNNVNVNVNANSNDKTNANRRNDIPGITAEDVWKRMPLRKEDSHKGTYGKLLMVSGSLRYRGAAALCAEGALRSGCGIVTLAGTEPVFLSTQPRLPECICLPCRADSAGGIAAGNLDELAEELDNGYTALLMGPGMGNTESTRQVVTGLVGAASCPVILDADALNACAPAGDSKTSARPAGDLTSQTPPAAFRLPHPQAAPLVITPHPGEMARLTGLSIAEVKARREEIASTFAREQNCVVILKEHRTLIAGPDGSLRRNTTGGSGLARGGSGDILAGMIGSFLAQGMDPVDASICAVWLHGAAADRCAAKNSLTGMLPHDLFSELGQLFLENRR